MCTTVMKLADTKSNTSCNELQASSFARVWSGKISLTIISAYIITFTLAVISGVDSRDGDGEGGSLTMLCEHCD